jgi:hypothetical protein
MRPAGAAASRRPCPGRALNTRRRAPYSPAPDSQFMSRPRRHRDVGQAEQVAPAVPLTRGGRRHRRRSAAPADALRTVQPALALERRPPCSSACGIALRRPAPPPASTLKPGRPATARSTIARRWAAGQAGAPRARPAIAGRNEAHFGQAQRLARFEGEAQVRDVQRIEGAAEEAQRARGGSLIGRRGSVPRTRRDRTDTHWRPWSAPARRSAACAVQRLTTADQRR